MPRKFEQKVIPIEVFAGDRIAKIGEIVVNYLDGEPVLATSSVEKKHHWRFGDLEAFIYDPLNFENSKMEVARKQNAWLKKNHPDMLPDRRSDG